MERVEQFDRRYWAVILGGSSGFGLATARTLAQHGMNLCLVHRDRRAALPALEREFSALRDSGIELRTFNRDATSADDRRAIVEEIEQMLRPDGCVRLLMHSIAFGNLKPLNGNGSAARRRQLRHQTIDRLALALEVPSGELAQNVERLFEDGCDPLLSLVADPARNDATLGDDDFTHTVHAMGTSLVGWVQELHRRGLFASDARVLSMTSEGNSVAWRGYAAVSAAKAALEAVSRSLAVEFAPYGLRANVIQAGVTNTPALRHIPGHEHLMASARLRNPFHRLTTPDDVARVVYLLCRDEASWINGSLIRVDGGEHIAGV